MLSLPIFQCACEVQFFERRFHSKILRYKSDLRTRDLKRIRTSLLTVLLTRCGCFVSCRCIAHSCFSSMRSIYGKISQKWNRAKIPSLPHFTSAATRTPCGNSCAGRHCCPKLAVGAPDEADFHRQQRFLDFDRRDEGFGDAKTRSSHREKHHQHDEQVL